MQLFTSTIRAVLLANGTRSRSDIHHDPVPVVKLFTPDAGATWLLTELDPENPDIAFGICDLGLGSPELGSVSIREIESLRGALGLPVERDLHFHSDRPLSLLADAARSVGAIRI